MRVRFLGTNGWYDTHTGNTLCTLIECSSAFIVLDTGNAKMLALVHFDANEYSTLEARRHAEAREFFDRTFAVTDDMEIEI